MNTDKYVCIQTICFFFFFETGSPYVALTGLKLTASASWVLGSKLCTK